MSGGFVRNSHGDPPLAEADVSGVVEHPEAAAGSEAGLPAAQSDLTAGGREPGDLQAAVEAFAEALRLDPEHADAARGFARTLRAQGHTPAAADRAVETLRQGVVRAARDRQRPGGEQYYGILMGSLMRQHSETVGSCRKAADAAAPFDLFLTVGSSGAVTEAAASPPTLVGDCIAQALAGTDLPGPPFGPFHARLTMRLGG